MSQDKTARFIETVVLPVNNYPGGPPRSLGNKYELSDPHRGFTQVITWVNMPADEWETHVIGIYDGCIVVLEYCDEDDSDEECLAQLGYKLEE